MNGVRTPSRPVLVGVAVWIGVVALVAALVWVVITRAGAGVTGGDDRLGDTGVPAPVGSSSSSREPGTSSGPPSGSRTPTPSDGATTQPTPDAEPVARTARGAGGTLTASCSGTAVSLVAATPTGGWGAEVEDSGPDRVRVDFEDDETRTRIEATCVDGSPSFHVEEGG